MRVHLRLAGEALEGGEACGYDGIQALLLAMNLIAAHLYNSVYHHDDCLVWGEHEDGYGFPLAQCLKDLARGFRQGPLIL